MGTPFRTVGFAAAILIAGAAAGHAAGGGGAGSGSGGGSGAASSQKACKSGLVYSSTQRRCVPQCRTGYLYSSKQKKCVKHQTGVMQDGEIKEQGWALARAGAYDEAIALFALLEPANDAEALNGLGYSHRKLGRIETGIAYYGRALAIDPDYVQAREYLGEGYAASGRLDLAREQLGEIERRCGRTCEEYVMLASVIAGLGTPD